MSIPVVSMARQRTIKVSEEEYKALKRTQKELEAIKDTRMTQSLGPPLPADAKPTGIDWGGVALGAVAALGAIALLNWLTQQRDETDE